MVIIKHGVIGAMEGEGACDSRSRTRGRDRACVRWERRGTGHFEPRLGRHCRHDVPPELARARPAAGDVFGRDVSSRMADKSSADRALGIPGRGDL